MSSSAPDSIQQPPTPLSPTGSDGSRPNTATTNNSDSVPLTNSPPKRKPSRRANTAERRATHNAVERQRRETLNGRFLDLAALLPNLATVRRPSKSAIVNSSIALIHSQRRARAAAGRELRALEAEADALRREVNEWRARSGAALPALLPPQRSPEFIALAGAEDTVAGAEEEERRAYALAGAGMDDDDDLSPADDAPRGMPGPAPASVSTVVVQPSHDADKLAQWNAHLQYALAQQQAQQVRQQEWVHHQPQTTLFTPPSTAHGHENPAAPDVYTGFARQFPTTPHFTYGLPGFTNNPSGATPEMDDSSTESTGSPVSAGAAHGPHPQRTAAGPTTTAIYSGAYPRRMSLSVAHAHVHPTQGWAGAGAGGAQFPPVSLLI